MDLSKSNRFSSEEAINYIPRTEKKGAASMWNAPVLWVFVFLHEDNSMEL